MDTPPDVINRNGASVTGMENVKQVCVNAATVPTKPLRLHLPIPDITKNLRFQDFVVIWYPS